MSQVLLYTYPRCVLIPSPWVYHNNALTTWATQTVSSGNFLFKNNSTCTQSYIFIYLISATLTVHKILYLPNIYATTISAGLQYSLSIIFYWHTISIIHTEVQTFIPNPLTYFIQYGQYCPKQVAENHGKPYNLDLSKKIKEIKPHKWWYNRILLLSFLEYRVYRLVTKGGNWHLPRLT